jgi:hypothetical protein
MRNMMKAADAIEVTNAAETAMDGAATVQAGMDAVSAAMTTPVSTTVSAAMTTTVSAAVTPASGCNGRGESRRNERAGDGSSDGHCSKHGAVSS